MTWLNKNFNRYLNFEISLLNFILLNFLITMGKMENFKTLHFMRFVHQVLNYLERLYLANNHFQIDSLKWKIEKFTNLNFTIKTSKLFGRPSYVVLDSRSAL